MKFVLDVKDKRALKPIKNDVIIFDGKEWYLTTKEDILKESLELIKNANEKIKYLEKENEDFKNKIASQMLEMSEIIEKVYSEKGE